MTAYTSAAEIAAHLGVTLTPEQSAQADVAAVAVTTWIDHRTGQSWQDADGSVDDEQHAVTAGQVWLTSSPVVAVSAISARRGAADTFDALDPDAWYLADARSGRVVVSGLCSGQDVRVTYTHAIVGPPADLTYAATVLAADLLQTALHPESAGLAALSVGQNDISVRYATATERSGGAAVLDAVAVVDSYAPRAVIA